MIIFQWFLTAIASAFLAAAIAPYLAFPKSINEWLLSFVSSALIVRFFRIPIEQLHPVQLFGVAFVASAIGCFLALRIKSFSNR